MDVKSKDTLAAPVLNWRKKPRRRFTAEQRLSMVLECEQPGVSVAQIARRHGINANLLFGWRKLHSAGQLVAAGNAVPLLPVTVVEPAGAGAGKAKRKYTRQLARADGKALRSPGAIEIELAGARIYLHGSVSEANLQAVLKALAGK